MSRLLSRGAVLYVPRGTLVALAEEQRRANRDAWLAEEKARRANESRWWRFRENWRKVGLAYGGELHLVKTRDDYGEAESWCGGYDYEEDVEHVSCPKCLDAALEFARKVDAQWHREYRRRNG